MTFAKCGPVRTPLQGSLGHVGRLPLKPGPQCREAEVARPRLYELPGGQDTARGLAQLLPQPGIPDGPLSPRLARPGPRRWQVSEPHTGLGWTHGHPGGTASWASTWDQRGTEQTVRPRTSRDGHPEPDRRPEKDVRSDLHWWNRGGGGAGRLFSDSDARVPRPECPRSRCCWLASGGL